MKKIMVLIIAALIAPAAQAGCVGSGSMYSCTDSSGNSYNVRKYGNTTTVDGYNSNGSWSSTSQKFGNTTYQSGTSIDGGSWNQTIRSNSYGTTIDGTNSRGKSYNRTCTAYGCY